MRNRRAKKIILWTLGVLSTPLLLGFAYGFYLTHTTEPPPTYELHSNLPYHEVDIPFTLRDGLIYLPLRVAQWRMDALLDTGAFDMTWDERLNLPGRITGRTLSVVDVGNNKIPQAEQVVLRSVGFGDYEVKGLMTYAINTEANPKSIIGHMAQNAPLVGNEAFCGGVVTIDYYQKKIIVRDRSYDFTKNNYLANGIILPFRRQTPNAELYYGKIIVPSKVNGFPAQLQIDTGWSGSIGLNQAFAAKIVPSNGGATAHTDKYGNAMRLYPAIPVTLERRANATPQQTNVTLSADFTAKIHAVTFPNVHNKWDAIVGYKLLRFFRVTIDYPRQKILLEPYGKDKVHILPKGSLLTIDQAGKKPTKERFAQDMVICRYADGNFIISP